MRFTAGDPVARAPGQHAAARHARHRAVRDERRARHDPGRRRPVDDAPRPAGRVRGRRVRARRASTASRAARRCRGARGRAPDVAERLALYRDLIALRREHPVLGTGGLRWLHVDDETVVFVRESARGVDPRPRLARRRRRRAAHRGCSRTAREAEALFGDATLAGSEDGGVLLSADGPAFAVWTLPGVTAPAVTPELDEPEHLRGQVDADTPTPAEEVEGRSAR